MRQAGLATVLGILFGLAGPALAIDAPKVDVHGQWRGRAMIDSGRDFVAGGFAERELVNQRARLWADVGSKEKGSPWVRVMAQDVRVWGEEGSPVHDLSANGLDLQEAFVALPMQSGLTLKLGRQELIYDNHRLIGNIGWLQRAQSFDGLRAIYQSGSLTFDGFAVMMVERESFGGDGTVPAGRAGDARLAGAQVRWTDKKPAEPGQKPKETMKASFSYFLRDNDAARELRHTIGGIFWGKFGGLVTTVEAYGQAGSLGDDSISAWMGALDLGYGLDAPGKPMFAVFADVLSGDGTAGGAFDTLHATNHKFYGEMDLFLAIPNHTARLGLIDAGVRLVGRKVGPVKVLATFHQFMAQKADANGEKTFGQELDLKIATKLMPNLALRALYGIFLPGEAMRTARKIAAGTTLNTEHFIYITLDAKL